MAKRDGMVMDEVLLVTKLRSQSPLQDRILGLKEVVETIDDYTPTQQTSIARQLLLMIGEGGREPLLNSTLAPPLLSTLLTFASNPIQTHLLSLNDAFLEMLSSWSLEFRPPLPQATEILYLSLLAALLSAGATSASPKPTWFTPLLTNAVFVLGGFHSIPAPPNPPSSPRFTSALAILNNLLESYPAITIHCLSESPTYKEKIWDFVSSLLVNVATAAPSQPRPLTGAQQIRTEILLIRLVLGLDLNSNPKLLGYTLNHGLVLVEGLLKGTRGRGRVLVEEEMLGDLTFLMSRLTSSLETLLVGSDLRMGTLLENSGLSGGSGSEVPGSSAGPSSATSSNNKVGKEGSSGGSGRRNRVHQTLLTSYLALAGRVLASFQAAPDSLWTCSSGIASLLSVLVPASTIDFSSSPLAPSFPKELLTLAHFGDLLSILRRLEKGVVGGSQRHTLLSLHHRIFYTALHHHSSPFKETGEGESAQVVESLSKVVAGLSFRPESSVGEITVTARLLGLALTVGSLRQEVLGRLLASGEAISAILTDLLEVNPGMESAWCVVEVLGLLGDNSRNKAVLDLLLTAVQHRGAAGHLAFALRSPAMSMVTRALTISSTVAFSWNNIKELGEALVRMNGGEPEPLPLLTSPSAAMAIQAIERTLAKVGDQSSQDGVPLDRFDVVTLYEERMKLLSLQMTQVQAHLAQTTEWNGKLSELLAKNGRVTVSNLAELETKDILISRLQGEVEKLSETVAQKEGVAAEATRSLRSAIQFNNKKLEEAQKTVKTFEGRILGLQGEIKNLNKKLEVESAGRKKQELELADVLAKLKQKEDALKEEVKKVGRQEGELRAAAEEKQRMEHLLAKERQTVDVIRGALLRNGPENV